MIGTVEKVIEDKDEIVINLGDMKVTALRSTIHQKDDPRLRDKPAKKDDKADKVDTTAKEKDPAKPAKKTASAKEPASKTAKKK